MSRNLMTKRERMTLLGAAIGCTTPAPGVLEGFALLKKIPGRDTVPHDCLRELGRDDICTVCGARYEPAQGIHLVGKGLRS